MSDTTHQNSSHVKNYLRSLFVLGRVSNLPTVWSNCLTGWVLTGNSDFSEKFFVLLACASLFYIGGMFWNDTMDIEWDRKRAPERPIPCGNISLRHAWLWGGFWFTSAFGLALFLGSTAVVYAALLFIAILLYDWCHKKISWAPVIMAACRFWLILFAAAASFDGRPLPGAVIWSATFLFAYIVGLSYIARHERLDTPFDLWPLLLLLAPVIWGFVSNAPSLWVRSVAFTLPFVVWTGWALTYILMPSRRNPGKVVSLLLAGIVLTDLVALQPWGGGLLYILVALFILCPFLQKFVPAT